MSIRTVKIGTFLKRRKDPIEIQDSALYKRLTIKTKHQGISLRDEVKGTLIGTKLQFLVQAGQFLLSKIDARLGAFGIVPEELDKGIITGNFWAFDVNEKLVDIEWFNLFTSSGNFYSICNAASSGTTHRKYLDERSFLNFEIPLPEIKDQKAFLSNYHTFKSKFDQLTGELTQQQTYLQFLRQTILQEAVQGKLTHREPTDEPAATLLARIKAEKAQLVKAGKLKKEKELPPIAEAVMPFALPEGWVWCRLGDLCTKIGSGSTPKGGKDVYSTKGVKFIRSQNVYNEGLVFDNVAYIGEQMHEKMSNTKVLPGDLLLNITGGSIGRCALVDDGFDEGNVNQHVTILRPVISIKKEFLHKVIISPYFQDYIMSTQTGGNREGLAKKNMELMYIPLPSFNEQCSILTIIEKVLNKINSLEKELESNKTTSQLLLQTILKEAFQSQKEVYGLNQTLSLAAEA